MAPLGRDVVTATADPRPTATADLSFAQAAALVVRAAQQEDPDRAHGARVDQILAELRSGMDAADVDELEPGLGPELAAAYRLVLGTDEGAAGWAR